MSSTSIRVCVRSSYVTLISSRVCRTLTDTKRGKHYPYIGVRAGAWDWRRRSHVRGRGCTDTSLRTHYSIDLARIKQLSCIVIINYTYAIQKQYLHECTFVSTWNTRIFCQNRFECSCSNTSPGTGTILSSKRAYSKIPYEYRSECTRTVLL